MRLALVAPGFAPYRVPAWNALAQRCDLTIVLMAPKARSRSWTLDLSALHAPVVCLDSPQIVVRRMDWVLNLPVGGVGKALGHSRPDAIIVTNYDSPGFWTALMWARRHRVPVTIAMGSHGGSTRTAAMPLVTALKRAFVGRCASGYTYSGRAGRDYLAWLGMRADRIVTGYNPVPLERFPSAERIGKSAVPHLLYVGQLLPRKGLREMVRALALVADTPWNLSIVGKGPELVELRTFATAKGIGPRIAWRDHVPYDLMADVYRSADILIFPSLREVWGLVVNEALLSGLYVVGSRHAPSSEELIRPGITGSVFDPSDIDGFAAALRTALSSAPFDRNAIRASVLHVTPEDEANRLIEAVRIGQAR